MFQRYSNSPRYFGRCFELTWICVPLIPRFRAAQAPSIPLIVTPRDDRRRHPRYGWPSDLPIAVKGVMLL